MSFKVFVAAVLVACAGVSASHAQSASDFSGPRELPPASFTGQQYVDSRGCVFLRAGLAGRTNWVPRVTSDRRQMCGYPPTLRPRPVEVVRSPAAPEPQTTRRPIETVATTTTPPRIRQAPPPAAARVPAETYAAPPVVMARPAAPAPAATPPANAAPRVQAARPAAVARPAPEPAPAPRRTRTEPANGCYADAPVRETFEVRGGGTITLCTRGDRNLDHARPPRLMDGSASNRRVVITRSTQNVVPPPGYKPAWEDDRLNPRRGQGTAQGWAQQDQVWTRDHPAQLVEDVPQRRVVVREAVHSSTKSSPVAPTAARTATASGGAFVQVGLFGVPANAQGAAARLSGLGMPVRVAKASQGGRALQSVMAGPFASAAEAQAALSAIRRAGFGDAYLR